MFKNNKLSIFLVLLTATVFTFSAKAEDDNILNVVHKGNEFQLKISVVDAGEPIFAPHKITVESVCGTGPKSKTKVVIDRLGVCMFDGYAFEVETNKLTLNYKSSKYDEKEMRYNCVKNETQTLSLGAYCKQ